jgi:hypothetical protein
MSATAPARGSVPAAAGDDSEAAYLRRLKSLRSIPRMLRPMQELSLDPRAGFICSMVDGTTSIEDIIDMSGAPRLDVLRILDDLVAQGGAAVD